MMVGYASSVLANLPVVNPVIIISNRVFVQPSAINSIGFKSNILEIEFNTGRIYQYFDVPHEIYQDLMIAPSKGRFYNTNIKGNYSVIRIR